MVLIILEAVSTSDKLNGKDKKWITLNSNISNTNKAAHAWLVL